MKKFLALLVSLIMLMSCCTLAQAALIGTSSGVTDLTCYLGATTAELFAIAPEMTVTDDGSAYTSGCEIWLQFEGDYITCISIESDAYSLYGITPGMSVDMAARTLSKAGYAFEDQGNQLWVFSSVTGLSYIDANYENGVITSIMCGAVEVPSSSSSSSGSVVSADGVTDLTDLLGSTTDRMYAIAPDMTVGSTGDSAYTSGFEIWMKFEGDYITCISIESAAYSLYGISPEMTVEDASAVLAARGIDFEDKGTELWANSRATSLSYISAEYENGKITEIMCGAVEVPASSSSSSGSVVSADGVTDLTDLLGSTTDRMYAIAPDMTVGSTGNSAYTPGFEIWMQFDGSYITCISIESAAYSLYGISPEMTVEDASAVLAARGIDFEDQGTELWANSRATGLSYISANYENGKITEIMCGAVEVPSSSADSSSSTVTSASGAELSSYLAGPISAIVAAVPDMTLKDTYAATPAFDVYASMENEDPMDVGYISIESSSYSLLGVKPGMTESEVKGALTAAGLEYEVQDDGGLFVYNIPSLLDSAYMSVSIENGIATEVNLGHI